jgi:hypothetical protein
LALRAGRQALCTINIKEKGKREMNKLKRVFNIIVLVGLLLGFVALGPAPEAVHATECYQPVHHNIIVNPSQQATAAWTWYDISGADSTWTSSVTEDVLVVGYSRWHKNGAANSTVACLGGNLDGTRHEALRFTFENDDWPMLAVADIWLDVPAGGHAYKLQFQSSSTTPKVQEQHVTVLRFRDDSYPLRHSIYTNPSQQPAQSWTWYDVTGSTVNWSSSATENLLVVGYSKWNKNEGGAADIVYLAGNLDGNRQENLRFSFENAGYPVRTFVDVRSGVTAGNHTYKLQFLASSTSPIVLEQRVLILRMGDCFPPAMSQIWVNTGQQPAQTWTWYDVTGANCSWSAATQDLLVVGFSKWNKNGGDAADVSYLAGNLDSARQESFSFSYNTDDWPERAFVDLRTNVPTGSHLYKLQFMGSSTTPKIQEQRMFVLRLDGLGVQTFPEGGPCQQGDPLLTACVNHCDSMGYTSGHPWREICVEDCQKGGCGGEYDVIDMNNYFCFSKSDVCTHYSLDPITMRNYKKDGNDYEYIGDTVMDLSGPFTMCSDCAEANQIRNVAWYRYEVDKENLYCYQEPYTNSRDHSYYLSAWQWFEPPEGKTEADGYGFQRWCGGFGSWNMSYDLRGNNPPYEDQAPNSCNARIHPTGANAWPFNGHFVSPRFIVKTNPSFCNVTTDTHYYYWRGTDINGWHQEPWCGCSMGDLYRSSSMDNAVMGQPPGYCEQSTTVCDPNGQNCWSGPAMRYSFTGVHPGSRWQWEPMFRM